MNSDEEKTIGDIYDSLPVGDKIIVAGVVSGTISIEDYYKMEQLKRDKIVALCKCCGRPFLIKGNQKKYCSAKCRNYWYGHRNLGKV